MLAIVVVIPLVLFPPVLDPVQSACGVEPVTATAAEMPIVEAFTRRVEAYMEIHNDVERRLAVQWVFDDPEDLFDAKCVRCSRASASRVPMPVLAPYSLRT